MVLARDVARLNWLCRMKESSLASNRLRRDRQARTLGSVGAVSQGNRPAVTLPREHTKFGILEAWTDITCARFYEPLLPHCDRG